MVDHPPNGLRLGILGGTFDPIHIGHLIIAEEARARLGLDRVLFAPAHHSPLKGQHTCFDTQARCQMVAIAIADNPFFALSRIDADRQGPSFTIDTLRLLHAEYGQQTQLFFIMGMDSLETFDRWRSPREIISLARIAVITRPEASINMAKLERRVPGITKAVDLLPDLMIGISSTEIRQRLAQGLPIKYQVPTAVERYLATHPCAQLIERD